MKPPHAVAVAALLTLAAQSFAQSAPATVVPAQPVHADEAHAAKTKDAPVYDESADGRAQITAALWRAKKYNRRVIVQWGANWCVWCKALHRLCVTDPKVGAELASDYELIHIDVGRFDKHMDLAQELKADLKGAGLPYLTILDADGKPLANQETSSLEKPTDPAHAGEFEHMGHDPAKVITFLSRYHAPSRNANEHIAEALLQARAEHKHLLLRVASATIAARTALEHAVDRPEALKLLTKDFVDCPIDPVRDSGAAQALKTWTTDATQPKVLIVDVHSKLLAEAAIPLKALTPAPTSAEAVQPWTQGDIDQLTAALSKGAISLKPAEIESITSGLKTKS